MMRLDKFLCECGIGTRSQVKEYLKKGMVTLNGDIVKRPELKVDETTDYVLFQNTPCLYEKFRYFLLHKPAGVVTATKDTKDITVISLLNEPKKEELFPVGRLDKDTEGLLLITDDGDLAHRLLSPRMHVEKVYEVYLEHPLSQQDIETLETGVDIQEKKLTGPAKVMVLDYNRITLSITEGKYHQVKRMLKAVGNQVVYLKRLSMGPLVLDEALAKGDYRKLTEEEISLLMPYRKKSV